MILYRLTIEKADNITSWTITTSNKSALLPFYKTYGGAEDDKLKYEEFEATLMFGHVMEMNQVRYEFDDEALKEIS